VLGAYNILYLNRDLPRLAETIRAAGPDAIGLSELTPEAEAFLDADLGGLYPHRVFRGELALLSRLPLADVRYLPPDHERKGVLAATLLSARGPVRVAVVHLTPPTLERRSPAGVYRTLEDCERAHREELGWALRMVGEQGPRVIIGDFNSLPHQAPRRLLYRRGFVDAAARGRIWPGPTWRGPIFGTDVPLRIDYVYASADLEILGTREVDSPASDHFLLLARLGLPER